MIQITQTITSPPKGNCFAACVASIFEMPLAEVPNFVGDCGDKWWYEFRSWLHEKHLDAWFLPVEQTGDDWFPKGYSILTGGSPRGDWNHCVVAKDGEIIWDPSPGPNKGALRSKVDWTVFLSLDPSKRYGVV